VIPTIRIPLLAAIALTGLGLTTPAQAQQDTMSFFVTSAGKGNGVDLGGLAGADGLRGSSRTRGVAIGPGPQPR
jgi:hypothetical protein